MLASVSQQLCGLALLAVVSQAVVVEIPLSFDYNSGARADRVAPTFPVGNISLGGISFSIPTGEPNQWSARSASFPGLNYLSILSTVAPGLCVQEVHTLINSFNGSPSKNHTQTDLYISGKYGASHHVRFIGQEQIRSHEISTHPVNATSDPNTQQVWQSGDGNHVLDKQRIVLPVEFQRQELLNILLVDSSTDFHAGILAGVTVVADTCAPQGPSARYVAVPIPQANMRLHESFANGPSGDLALDGGIFHLEPLGNNALVTNATVGSHVIDFDLAALGIPDTVENPMCISKIKTVANTLWGVPEANLGRFVVESVGSAAAHTHELIDNRHVRDWNINYEFATQISASSTAEAFSITGHPPVGPEPSSPDVLDVQTIDVPSRFMTAAHRVGSLRIVDHSTISVHALFVYGVSVRYEPCVATAASPSEAAWAVHFEDPVGGMAFGPVGDGVAEPTVMARRESGALAIDNTLIVQEVDVVARLLDLEARLVAKGLLD